MTPGYELADLLLYLLTWACLLPAMALVSLRWGRWQTPTDWGLAVFGGCLTGALAWLLIGDIATQLHIYPELAQAPWRPLIFRSLLALGLWVLMLTEWRNHP